MAFIKYSEIGDTPLQKLLGHNVEVLKSWDHLLESFYKYSSFDPALQEEVRRAIAYQIGCTFLFQVDIGFWLKCSEIDENLNINLQRYLPPLERVFVSSSRNGWTVSVAQIEQDIKIFKGPRFENRKYTC